jgi:hypothetical protein
LKVQQVVYPFKVSSTCPGFNSCNTVPKKNPKACQCPVTASCVNLTSSNPYYPVSSFAGLQRSTLQAAACSKPTRVLNLQCRLPCSHADQHQRIRVLVRVPRVRIQSNVPLSSFWRPKPNEGVLHPRAHSKIECSDFPIAIPQPGIERLATHAFVVNSGAAAWGFSDAASLSRVAERLVATQNA